MRIANIRLATGLAVGSAALLAIAQQGLKAGAAAPEFTATGLDGKTYTLKGLMDKGPVILYFIKYDCPVNTSVAKYYVALSRAYDHKVQDKPRFIGVINGDKNIALAWAKTHHPTFPILLDPDYKIIRSYKAIFSPWVMKIDKGQKVSKVWAGASAPYLREISASLAKALKANVVNLDTTGLGNEPGGG